MRMRYEHMLCYSSETQSLLSLCADWGCRRIHSRIDVDSSVIHRLAGAFHHSRRHGTQQRPATYLSSTSSLTALPFRAAHAANSVFSRQEWGARPTNQRL